MVLDFGRIGRDGRHGEFRLSLLRELSPQLIDGTEFADVIVGLGGNDRIDDGEERALGHVPKHPLLVRVDRQPVEVGEGAVEAAHRLARKERR